MLFMPMIRTNAPSGSARTPYSVSPRRKLHRRGPNPMKNWVAFMPVHLAVTKCPSSWKKIAISTPTTNTNHHTLSTARNTSSPMRPITPSAPRQPPTSSSSGDSVTDPPATTSFWNFSNLLTW